MVSSETSRYSLTEEHQNALSITIWYYTAPSREVEYRDDRVSLYICLSVPEHHISRTTHLNFTKFSVRVACGRGSVVLLWRRNLQYVVYFRFCGYGRQSDSPGAAPDRRRRNVHDSLAWFKQH